MIRSAIAVALALAACGGAPAAEHDRGGPPAFAVGSFVDDYGEKYTITAATWLHHPSATYHVVEWNRAGRFMVARNGKDNWTDPGLWTRIDWIELDGMPPFDWAFCMSAYKEPSRAAARAVTIARPEAPKTGCNGFPYSRMKRVDSGVFAE